MLKRDSKWSSVWGCKIKAQNKKLNFSSIFILLFFPLQFFILKLLSFAFNVYNYHLFSYGLQGLRYQKEYHFWQTNTSWLLRLSKTHPLDTSINLLIKSTWRRWNHFTSKFIVGGHVKQSFKSFQSIKLHEISRLYQNYSFFRRLVAYLF